MRVYSSVYRKKRREKIFSLGSRMTNAFLIAQHSHMLLLIGAETEISVERLRYFVYRQTKCFLSRTVAGWGRFKSVDDSPSLNLIGSAVESTLASLEPFSVGFLSLSLANDVR